MQEVTSTLPAYRWIVLAVTMTALAVSAGMRWSLAGFLPAWQHTFHVSAATIALAASLTLLVYGLSQPWVGRAVLRFGVKRVMVAGAAALGGSLVLTSLATNPIGVDAAFGILGGAGFAALAQVTAAAAVTDWFPNRRGLALGLCNVGNSLGMLFLGPATLLMIHHQGWRAADRGIGLGVFVVLVPLLLLFVKPAPAASRPMPPIAALNSRGIFEHPDFWRLAISFFICGYTTNGLMGTHLVAFLNWRGFSYTAAALAIGTMGGANALGALASGFLSDRIGRPRLLAAIYGLRALSLVLLLVVSSVPLMVVLSAGYGLLDYATVPPTASLAVDRFGRSKGISALAWILLCHQFGASVSSLSAGFIYDATGSYTPVFLVATVLLVGATGLSLSLKSPVAPTISNVSA